MVAMGAIAFEPFLFAGAFAGDAQVHLVFAERAAHGRFFEFNPGEHVSGETSPGYMLLGAALFHLVPARGVPVALKLIGLVAWYLLCWLVYLVTMRLFAEDDRRERFWPGIAASAAALIPGSVYNANVGMENGLFATAVWMWIYLAAKWRWFERSGTPMPAEGRSIGQEIALSALLGLACWLRPEGLVLLALAHTIRCYTARPPRRLWLLGLLVAAAIGLASIVFQFVFTGDLVATSILSRRVLTMRRSLHLGPLTIDPAFAERMILYLPLTAYFVLGVRKWGQAGPEIYRFLLALIALFFGLYTFVTGGAQLARYAIFLMPVFAIGAARGARIAWEGGRREGRMLLGLAALAFGATNIGESWYRRQRSSQDLLSMAMAAPAERRTRTDALLHELGDPAKRPVVLAVEAVQMRYELDDRFLIRSLDGRVDRALLQFVHDGTVDHVGYLKLRGVDTFAIPPRYNRSPSTWSLAALSTLGPGETTHHDGLTFRRRTSWLFAIENPGPTAF
jgi:hypothetical protein